MKVYMSVTLAVAYSQNSVPFLEHITIAKHSVYGRAFAAIVSFQDFESMPANRMLPPPTRPLETMVLPYQSLKEPPTGIGFDHSSDSSQLFKWVMPTTPEKVAQTLVLGLRKDSSEILVGWQSHLAVWGNRLTPWMVERVTRFAAPLAGSHQTIQARLRTAKAGSR